MTDRSAVVKMNKSQFILSLDGIKNRGLNPAVFLFVKIFYIFGVKSENNAWIMFMGYWRNTVKICGFAVIQYLFAFPAGIGMHEPLLRKRSGFVGNFNFIGRKTFRSRWSVVNNPCFSF